MGLYALYVMRVGACINAHSYHRIEGPGESSIRGVIPVNSSPHLRHHMRNGIPVLWYCGPRGASHVNRTKLVSFLGCFD
jgi:hypothetical protein